MEGRTKQIVVLHNPNINRVATLDERDFDEDQFQRQLVIGTTIGDTTLRLNPVSTQTNETSVYHL